MMIDVAVEVKKRFAWNIGSLRSKASWCLPTVLWIWCLIGNPATLQAQTYSGPLVITKGGTYTGNWQSKDSEVPAVEVLTSEPVAIVNSNIRGAGYLIKSWNHSANITVRNTSGYGLTPTPWSNYKKPRRFVTLNNFKNLVVENCYLESTAGIYLGTAYEGDGSASQTVVIRYNKAKNIDGRVYGSYERSQFVQFNFRGNLPNAEIAWNQVINEPNKSLVEDNINIHNSRGTPGSPIRISDNYIKGAYPIPASGTAYSGGGIIAEGDGDLMTCTAYVIASGNQLVNLGNYCMGIAGGNNIHYYDNRAINSALFSDGTRFAMYTSGLWSKDFYNMNTTFDNLVELNTVGVTSWSSPNNRNDISVAENAVFINNTFLPGGPVSVKTEDDEYRRWTKKLQANGIVLGPRKNISANSNRAMISVEASPDEAGGMYYSYPTAFSDRATIVFSLERQETFVLEVYDMKGALVKQVASGEAEANKRYQFEFQRGGIHDGVYLARLTTPSAAISLKMVLNK